MKQYARLLARKNDALKIFVTARDKLREVMGAVDKEYSASAVALQDAQDSLDFLATERTHLATSIDKISHGIPYVAPSRSLHE